MNANKDYLEANRILWNTKTPYHIDSDFYQLPQFIAGQSSLNTIELALLGDLKGKKVLHLQCHFGQDSISLARMGAEVTAVDLSDVAITKAKELAKECGVEVHFICADVFQLDTILEAEFEIVFTSYGVIGWLPELQTWGRQIGHFLKPGGQLIFVEFHPVVWMFDEKLEKISYSYFNKEAIIEMSENTYADEQAQINKTAYNWNHSLADVFTALLTNGLSIQQFQEFDYAPYDVLGEGVAGEKGFQVKGLEGKLPLVYAIKALK